MAQSPQLIDESKTSGEVVSSLPCGPRKTTKSRNPARSARPDAPSTGSKKKKSLSSEQARPARRSTRRKPKVVAEKKAPKSVKIESHAESDAKQVAVRTARKPAKKKAKNKAAQTRNLASPARTTSDEERMRRRMERRKLNRIIDEVLNEGVEYMSLQEALEDVVGYSIDEAQALLEREREKRRRIAELEKMLKAETPEQRARRLRFEQRKRLRELLYRDDRSKLQKTVDTIRYYRFRHTQIWMEERGVNLQPWHVVAPIFLLSLMVASNTLFMPEKSAEAAVETFHAVCASCGHQEEVDRALFEKVAVALLSPQKFIEEYPNEHLPTSSCDNCNIVHTELTMVSCIDSDHRFIVRQGGQDRLPFDPRHVAGMCPYHNGEHDHEVVE